MKNSNCSRSCKGLFSFMRSLMMCLVIIHSVSGISGVATLTYYSSYAECCEGEANYDPNADTTECVEYDACEYSGEFAALDGKKSLQYVQNNSLIAFYEYGDGEFTKFYDYYAGKNITLVKGNKIIFTAIIVDTCGDADCDGCCSENSKDTGYLVDLEYYTMMRNFNHPDDAGGYIEFYIDEEYIPSSSSDDDDGLEYYFMIGGVCLAVLVVCCVGILCCCWYSFSSTGKGNHHPVGTKEGVHSWRSVALVTSLSTTASTTSPAIDETAPLKSQESAKNVPEKKGKTSKQAEKKNAASAQPVVVPSLSSMFDKNDSSDVFSNVNPNMHQ